MPHKYTPGEVKAVLAPIFDVDPEKIEHTVVLISVVDDDGEICQMVGHMCSHAPQLMLAALSQHISGEAMADPEPGQGSAADWFRSLGDWEN